MSWESSINSRNSQHATKSKQEGGGAAGLEYKLVWKDEHARLREKVSINMFGFDDRKNLAIDQIQHFLPCFARHRFQSILLGSWR